MMRASTSSNPRLGVTFRGPVLIRIHTVLTAALLAATTVTAQDVQPGIDIFTTLAPPSGETTTGTYSDFSAIPIPAGFFCPGAAEFTGTVYFLGEPYTGIDIRWRTTDTVIRRLDVATLPGPGSEDTIPIEIVALSLVSVQPITVGCPAPDNLWNVRVCLSTAVPQPVGSMTIRQVDAFGGTFNSTLPVTPKFVFKNPATFSEKVLDAGIIPLSVDLAGDNGNWLYAPPASLGVVTVPPGLMVDGNCDTVLEVLPVGTSNFHPGVMSRHPTITAWHQGPVVFSVTRVDTEGEGLLQPDPGHPSPNDVYALDNGPFPALLRGAEIFQSSGSVLGAPPDTTNVDRISASWGVGPAPGGPPFMGPFLPSPTGSVQAILAGPPPGTLGLLPPDELDGLSFGRDGGAILVFSVRDDANGLPGSMVEFHSTLSPGAAPLGVGLPSNGGGNPFGGESGGDLYTSALFAPFGGANGPPFPAPAALGSNLLYLDEVDLGLQAPAAAYNLLGPEEDDLDAVELSDAKIVDDPPDGIPDYGAKLVFFSLAPGSPSLTPAVTPDDILVSTPGFLGGFAIYADGVVDIGLLPGDNLNALVLWDTSGPGGPNAVLDAGDEALFTLSPGSPSLAAGANPLMPPGAHTPGDVFHKIFPPGPIGIAVYATAAMMGVDPDDVIDALDIGGVWSPDGVLPDSYKPMTREQAAYAAHNAHIPQCQSVVGSQCINADSDGDKVPDDADNAPFQANHLQGDFDNDLVGDVADNCVNIPNFDQIDIDGDHAGDGCDTCPQAFNPSQDLSDCSPAPDFSPANDVRYFRGACSAGAIGTLCNAVADCGPGGTCDLAAGNVTLLQWCVGGSGAADVFRGMTHGGIDRGQLSAPFWTLNPTTNCLLANMPGIPSGGRTCGRSGDLTQDMDPDPDLGVALFYVTSGHSPVGGNVNAFGCANPGVCNNSGWCILGSDAGRPCNVNADCPGAGVSCQLQTTFCSTDTGTGDLGGCGRHQVCTGGANVGMLCLSSADCPGATCPTLAPGISTPGQICYNVALAGPTSEGCPAVGNPRRLIRRVSTYSCP